jgi:AcrR family transcriptional regulator
MPGLKDKKVASASPVPERRRDAVETRARILRAAKLRFSRQGYDQVGVREIAGDAGVNAALVNRYFGSKEGLFKEIAATAFDIDDVTQGPLAEWGERIARFLNQASPSTADKKDFDAFQFLLRSAVSPVAAPIVSQHLYASFVRPLAKRIGKEDAKLRATLVTAYILGFALSRMTLRLPEITSRNTDKITTFLGEAIQHCLTGKETPE